MEWIISNKRSKIKLAVITALVAFSTVFLLTGALLTTVYGVKPGDAGYAHYEGNGQEMTEYNNFLWNGCLTKTYHEGDKTIVLDTKGLEELGLQYIDPNICFDMAKTTLGYKITDIEPYGDDDMKITLTKK